MPLLEIISACNVKEEHFQKKMRRKFVKTSVIVSFSIFLQLNTTLEEVLSFDTESLHSGSVRRKLMMNQKVSDFITT